MLHVSVVPFLLLSSNPLYGGTTDCLTISLLMGIYVSSNLGLLQMKFL